MLRYYRKEFPETIQLVRKQIKIEGVIPLFFMSSSMKDFLDKFFDLCRGYQEEMTSNFRLIMVHSSIVRVCQTSYD